MSSINDEQRAIEDQTNPIHHPVMFTVNLMSKTECTIVGDRQLSTESKIHMIATYRGLVTPPS